MSDLLTGDFDAESHKSQKLIEACLLHFNGESFADIAILLEIHPNTLTRWRKTDIWKDYEAKLIDEWHQRQHANEKSN